MLLMAERVFVMGVIVPALEVSPTVFFRKPDQLLRIELATVKQ